MAVFTLMETAEFRENIDLTIVKKELAKQAGNKYTYKQIVYSWC